MVTYSLRCDDCGCPWVQGVTGEELLKGARCWWCGSGEVLLIGEVLPDGTLSRELGRPKVATEEPPERRRRLKRKWAHDAYRCPDCGGSKSRTATRCIHCHDGSPKSL